MKKKVFICGYINFPRGSASANYVQYLSKAFITMGYDVTIISNINYRELDKLSEEYKKNLIIENIRLSNSRLYKYIQFNFSLDSIVEEILNKYDFNSGDIIISYSNDPFLNKFLIKYAESKGIKSGSCICEWFTHREFKYSLLNYKYWKYIINFKIFYPKFNFLFPISRYIEEYFKGKGCKTMCLPIMSDPYEFKYEKKVISFKRKFIYPANGMIKDSIKCVLVSFSKLQDNELEKVELHLCGVSKSKIIKLMQPNLIERIGKNIIIHDWMEYEELVDLYKSMHFLILARDINRMTISNFPSKVPEVMGYGVIPLVSRVGDYTTYYLEDGVDSIIFSNNIEECSKAIKKVINYENNEVVKLSINARESCLRKFYYNNWAVKINTFIEE